MIASRRGWAGLKWLLIANLAASILHYADNLLFFDAYPEPPWIGRGMIDAFWFLMTPLAWSGYRMTRRGARRGGTLLLLIYAACGLLSLGHYRYAPMGSVAPRIHAFILLEAALAAILIAYLLLPRGREPAA